jgi:uncharacterized membrane protein YgdD (TMEM256/DUF423 family)
MFNIRKNTSAVALALAVSAGAAAAVTIDSYTLTDTTADLSGSGAEYKVASFNTALGNLIQVDVLFQVSGASFSNEITVDLDVKGLIATADSAGADYATALVDETVTTSLNAYESGMVSGFVTLASAGGTILLDDANAFGLFDNPDSFLSVTYTYEFEDQTPVPLPAGGALLIAGLGALAVARKKRKS